MRRIFRMVAVSVAASPTAAFADDLPDPVAIDLICDSSYATGVTVDGIQADWEEEAAPVDRIAQLVDGAWQYDYTGPNDASFRPWCRSSPDGIYLAIVGRDNIIVDPDDDEGDFVELRLVPDGLDDDEMRILRLDLGVVDGEGRANFVNEDGHSVADAWGEVAPREAGYFVEAFVPSAVLGGSPFAPIRLSIFQRDIDHDTSGERDVLVGSGASDEADGLGWLDFGLVDARIETIRERAHLDASDLYATAVGNVGAGPGREVVFAMADSLYVSGEGLPGFSWLTLVVRTSDDERTVSLELHDIDGDGDLEIFHRQTRPHSTFETGTVRTDDVVHVYDFSGDALVLLFAQVVAASLPDGRRLESTMTIRGRGDDREVVFGPASGDIDEVSWVRVDPAPGDETGPLALPWHMPDGVAWSRSGLAWSAGEP
jgi:hypothetical protein